MTTPQQLELPSYETVLLEAIRNIAIDSGIVSTAVGTGGNALPDSTKRWVGNIHRNRLVKIIKGQGAGQSAVILANSADALVINGVWLETIGAGALYVILGVDDVQALADAFGGGAIISATNPLPVDITPAQKTTTQIINLASLAAAATSTLANCTAVDLRGGPGSLTLTVVATYNAAAVLGLRVHVRTSRDNANWDTEDWDTWVAGFTAGATIRETENYATDPMFLKVLIENLDAGQAITGLAVHSSVGA
ncbi:hypothetical protein LCGC14_2065930 [marine sediment metagenome]|uniref:Uncharacterized protein n=1 Tax=marine sediment metagenome TaxID=412755 RepID=A0A0F9EJR7_9ZZZZ